jgi:hypothetical protein
MSFSDRDKAGERQLSTEQQGAGAIAAVCPNRLASNEDALLSGN